MTMPVGAPVSTAVGHRGSMLRSGSRGAYWPNSWKVTVLVLGLMVVRLGEVLGSLQLAKPVLLATIAAVLLHVVHSRPAAWRNVWRSPMLQAFLVYAALVVLSFPLSTWRGQTWATMKVLPWGVALIVVVGLTTPTIKAADLVVSRMSWLAAMLCAVLLLRGEYLEGNRLTSSGSYDPNDLGALFALTFCFAIGGVMRGSRVSRLVSLVAAGLLFFGLMKTGSRGALLGFIGGSAALLLSMRPQRIILGTIALLAAGPAVWSVLPESMTVRAATLLAIDEDYNTTSSSGRVYLWKRGLTFAAQNPVFGVGAGAFEAKLGHDFQEHNVNGAWHTAHNTYVQIAAEVGFGGLLTLLFLLFQYVRNVRRYWSWRSPVYRPDYLAALIAYALCIVFLSHGYSYLLFGVVALGGYLGMVTPERTSAVVVPSRGPMPGRPPHRIR